MKQNTTSKIKVVFYPNFNYKISINPENKNQIVLVNLLDQDGKIQYTNANNNHAQEWNFKFQSLMAGIIELKLKDENNVKDEQVLLEISYEKSDI